MCVLHLVFLCVKKPAKWLWQDEAPRQSWYKVSIIVHNCYFCMYILCVVSRTHFVQNICPCADGTMDHAYCIVQHSSYTEWRENVIHTWQCRHASDSLPNICHVYILYGFCTYRLWFSSELLYRRCTLTPHTKGRGPQVHASVLCWPCSRERVHIHMEPFQSIFGACNSFEV